MGVNSAETCFGTGTAPTKVAAGAGELGAEHNFGAGAGFTGGAAEVGTGSKGSSSEVCRPPALRRTGRSSGGVGTLGTPALVGVDPSDPRDSLLL